MLYAVLWGTKTFVVAPPTAANLELMRRWQMNGEAADDETFPADLEGARVVAVGRGQVTAAATATTTANRKLHSPPPSPPASGALPALGLDSCGAHR